ncbi:MAG TPA: enoyl-CoA hydratase-related protein [Candidatus Binataceae bacterium]|nr:enoyl-CoA hydratase-related protein [Candidatus Binataceae bacterium]
MKYQAIIYEKHGSIAKVITNRPRYKNAQSRVMIEEMDHAFKAAEADHDIRAIILAAAGDTFSSGHDIGTPEEKEDMRQRPYPKGIRGEYALSRDLFLDTTLRWRDLSKPTIAQVQGMCIFGGWMFAASMDLIVASDDAKFLPALMQYFSIPWDIPIRKAKEFVFRSRFIDAVEAERMGLVNLVVPRDQLESATMAFAEEIAANDPFTIRMSKWAINSAQDAMGYSHSIRNAHSHYMVQGLDSFTMDKLTGKGFPKVMPGVAQAMGQRKKDPEP